MRLLHRPTRTAAPRERRPLTAADMEGFNAASDRRQTTTSPSVQDLVLMCERLKPYNRVEATHTLRQLRWLCKAAERDLGANFEHPFRK